MNITIDGDEIVKDLDEVPRSVVVQSGGGGGGLFLAGSVE